MNETNPELAALLNPDPATTPRFPPNSRYAATPIARLTAPDGREVPYLRRRFVPSPERFAVISEHRVEEGDRLDRIAAQELGDPELFWRLCDANGAMRPSELTETIRRPLRITLPDGIPGGER